MFLFGETDHSAVMWLLRGVLLGGLVLHKAVWEVLKRRGQWARTPAPAGLALVKLAKIAILAGIIVQALLPFDVLPIFPLDAAATLRAVGFLLYLTGLAVAISARLELGRNWSDIEVGKLQSGHHVVSTGVYRLIRHPIYTGDLLLLAGLELALNSWLAAGVVLLAAAVAKKASQEEAGLAHGLPDYAAYCQRTKRFIPFVY